MKKNIVLKDYSTNELTELLKEIGEKKKQLQERIENCKQYIKRQEENIQLATKMIEEAQAELMNFSKQVQEISQAKENNHNRSTRIFPISDVYLMCYQSKRIDDKEESQIFVKGLMPYLIKYEELITGYEEKEENGELVQIPIRKEKESFTKNIDNVYYPLEECTLEPQNGVYSVFFPGIALKDIVQDMAEKNIYFTGDEHIVNYEEIGMAVRYAYENWREKEGWTTEKEDFFQTQEKVKKIG